MIAFGNSRRNPQANNTCTKFIPLRRESWSAPSSLQNLSLKLPGCGIFYRQVIRQHAGATTGDEPAPPRAACFSMAARSATQFLLSSLHEPDGFG